MSGSPASGAHTLTEQLAALVLAPVDDAAREEAASHLLDWIGGVVAATATPDGAILVDYTKSRPAGAANAIGAGRRDHQASAFLNAGLSIELEADATHRGARLHPGGVSIAAALAQTERLDGTASQLLDAIVRGYEAMVRLGESTGPAHYVHWHTTSTCGPFGSASAAASIAFDRHAIEASHRHTVLTSALGTALSATGGLWQTREEKTPTKMVHAGQAAVAGLAAAELALGGFLAPRAILEGRHGMFAATCADPEPDAITAPAPWKIHETSLKPWCGCRHVHPAVGVALELRELALAKGASVEDIVAIELRTYRDALAFADCPQPTSERSAMFSLQHAVASSLLTGDLPLSAFDQSRLDDPHLVAMRALVHVDVDQRVEQAYPEAWGARLRAELADGTELVVERRHAKGDPDDPLSTHDVEAKAASLMSWAGLSPYAIDHIVTAVGRLTRGGPVSDLTSALSEASRVLSGAG